MKNTTTIRRMMAIIAIIFVVATTSCKKENAIAPTSPLTGSWIREEQNSSGTKTITIIETINADLTGSEKRIDKTNGVVTATTVKDFGLEVRPVGFIQNFNLGPSVEVNYVIADDNESMIKSSENGSRRSFRRLN